MTISGPRKQFNVAMFGGNGTGKTTEEIKICVEYADANPDKRILFLLPDDGERKFDPVQEIEPTDEALRNFRGMAKVFAEDRKVFETLLKVYTQPMMDSRGNFVTDKKGN